MMRKVNQPLHKFPPERDQYFNVLKHLPDIVYIIDPDGRFLYLNPAIKILGYDPINLIGRHFWRIIHPDDRKKVSREFVLPALKGMVTGNRYAPKLFDERRTGDRQTRDLEIRLIPKRYFGKRRPVSAIIGSLIAWGNVSAAGRYDERRRKGTNNFQGTIGIIRDITERKTADDKIRDQEKQYRLLINNMNDGLMQVDNRDRVLFVNDHLCRMTGYTREELIGKTAYRLLFDPPEQAIIKKKNAQRYRKIADKYEIRMKKKNGGYLWIHISGSPVIDDRGRVMGSVGIFSDISARKRAERQLHFQADMLSHVSDAIITTDRAYIIQTWNRSAEKMLGIKAHEAIGKSFDTLIRTRNSGKAEKISFKKLVKTGQWFGEIAYTRKDGMNLQIQISLTLIRDSKAGNSSIVAIMRDITDRKQAEVALRTSEERYRALVENANDAIIVAQDGRLKFVNPRTVEILKYSKESIVSRPFTDFIHPEDRSLVMGRYLKRIAGKSAPEIYSFRIVDRQGGTRWVEIRSVLIVWAGRPATLNFLTDITGRKKYAHTLARYLEAEKTLAKASEMIIKTSNINLAITRILPFLGKTFNADWLGIFQLRDDRITLDNIHEWHKPGMKSLKPALQGITQKTNPWSFGKLKSGKIINCLTGDLPPASKSRKLYRKHGIKTILIIPIFYETRFFGTIGFFSKTPERIWDDEDIRLLKTTGDIIATSIIKHHIQVRLNQTLNELKTERKRMVELTKRTINTQEKERFYLSSEIHDNLLQELAGMLYYVKNIEAPTGVRDIAGKRDKLIENIKSLINRGRTLISYIEPLQDPAITLIQGIKKSFDLRFAGSRVRLCFDYPPKMPDIIFFLKVNILRIVQETFMNIYKHARATAISVIISLDKDQIIIKIKDNGAGFSSTKTDRGKKGHYGLTSMQERVKLIGGTLTIISKPGSGTVVTAEIPLK
jgi:PAS domain S-box-containing protein